MTYDEHGDNAPLEAPKKSTRGFAQMDPDKRRELARRGGKAAHAGGMAHEFTSDEARVAGRKGGKAMHAKARQQRENTP